MIGVTEIGALAVLSGVYVAHKQLADRREKRHEQWKVRQRKRIERDDMLDSELEDLLDEDGDEGSDSSGDEPPLPTRPSEVKQRHTEVHHHYHKADRPTAYESHPTRLPPIYRCSPVEIAERQRQRRPKCPVCGGRVFGFDGGMTIQFHEPTDAAEEFAKFQQPGPVHHTPDVHEFRVCDVGMCKQVARQRVREWAREPGVCL